MHLSLGFGLCETSGAEELSFRGPPRASWQVKQAVRLDRTPLIDEEHLISVLVRLTLTSTQLAKGNV